VAQRNRRRARGGGPNPRKNGRPSNGLPDSSANGADGAGAQNEVDRPFPELESGEEALTEAQLAFGRPELAEIPDAEELTAFEESESGRDFDAPVPAAAGALSTRRSSRNRVPDESAVVAEHEHKVGIAAQLTGFLKGSWRELQRVQWPDRRQVFQATGVVLGFVIVAGAFLAVASFAAQKVVNLILYGHG
jgi:preprotein translocase SecE subunit